MTAFEKIAYDRKTEWKRSHRYRKIGKWFLILSLIVGNKAKERTQNGGNKETKQDKFSEKTNIFNPPDTSLLPPF